VSAYILQAVNGLIEIHKVNAMLFSFQIMSQNQPDEPSTSAEALLVYQDGMLLF
jgi:hypothetical protein